HALIGEIREGGIEVLTAGSDAMFHGVYKVDGGPVSNAGLLVGRNVWDVKDAERRLEAASPGENILLFGLEVVALRERHRVTFGAAADGEHIFAVGEVGGVGGQRRGRNGGRHGQQAECERACNDEGEQRQQRSAQLPPPLEQYGKVKPHTNLTISLRSFRERSDGNPCKLSSCC